MIIINQLLTYSFGPYRREASLDVEVAASGHLKNLQFEYEEDVGEGEEEDEEEDQEGDQKVGEGYHSKELQEDQMVEEIEEKQEIKDTREVQDTQKVIEKEAMENSKKIGEIGGVEDAIEEMNEKLETIEINPKKERDSCLEVPVEEDDELTDAMSQNWPRIGRSRGVSGSVSSMSTIHPDVIKKQVKKGFTRQKNQEVAKRIRAKGEASAVTRKRRENNEAVRPGGIWGWDN